MALRHRNIEPETINSRSGRMTMTAATPRPWVTPWATWTPDEGFTEYTPKQAKQLLIDIAADEAIAVPMVITTLEAIVADGAMPTRDIWEDRQSREEHQH